MALTWTTQQLAIFNHCETSRKSLNVQARAGTGKSSTAVEIARRIPGRTLLCAFNKSIADELSTKVSSNPRATAQTLHSLGFKLYREIRQRAEVDSRKVPTLARKLYPYDKKVAGVVADAVGFAKLQGLGLTGCPAMDDEEAWTELFDEYELWDDIPGALSPERVMRDAIKVFRQSVDMCESLVNPVIDFNDMIYAPLLLGMWKPQRYDTVILDEAQDTSETRRILAQSVLVDGGRFIAVGDNFQCIYAFAGATHNAMDLIKEQFDSVELPLSMTFRCPKSVVKEAQTLVPDYEAAEGNPEGAVTTIKHEDFWHMAFSHTDVILCRNTRPLIGIAKRLRSDGIPCMVEGANGKSIISLMLKWGEDMTWGQYCVRLEQYVNKEVAKLMAKDKEEKAEYIQEKAAIIHDLADHPTPDTPLRSVVAQAERMFGFQNGQQAGDVLKLSTVHRSKGREWDRVILIGRNRYMPSKYAKTKEDMQSERNVEYVAITRAKRELVMVTVPMPPREGKEEVEWWEL
ncbi:MAG: 3'-5' exonuclease [Thermoplasmata archaeon]